MSQNVAHRGKRGSVANGVPILNDADGKEHERLIQDALTRGEIIPEEVLMDYPNLIPKAGETSKESFDSQFQND